MYESKEKSKEEPVPGKMKVGDGKDENQRPNEGIVMVLKQTGNWEEDSGASAHMLRLAFDVPSL